MNKITDKINLIIAGITFLISFIIYLVTMAPTTSFWDCGEFIATSVTMGVPHPPGTPLYLLLGNVFSQIPLFSDIGARVNIISVLVSAFSVMFVYLISVRIIEELRESTKSTTNKIINYGSSFIGAMTFAVTDSHWFNAVEAEVYSLSTFFTAIVVWLILKWSKEHDKPGNYRYILIIAYILGLATAVHLLNLLTLPFIALIIYFKKYKSHPLGIIGSVLFSILIILFFYIMIDDPVLGLWISPFLIFGILAVLATFDNKYTGLTITLICSLGILLGIYIGIIKGVPNLLDQLYNRIPYFGLHFKSDAGIITYLWDAISKFYLPLSLFIFLLVGSILLLTKKKYSQLLKLSISCLLMVYIGFSTYSIILIRASQEPRINENSPNTLKEFISYMNRDQYGQWSILDRASTIKRDENKYWNRYAHNKSEEVYTDENCNEEWDYSETYTDRNNNGQWDPGPTKGEVASFVWNYQIKEMYLRYFAWQFIGKEKWENRNWELNTLAEYYEDDNKNRIWDPGEEYTDSNGNGIWDNSQYIKTLQGVDMFRYFFPFAFILGLIGIIYHFYSDYRRALALLSLFLATGLLIIIYLNQYDPQPRERDYSYVGSFFVFSIWISIGLSGLMEQLSNFLVKKKIKEQIQQTIYGIIIGFIFIAMPFVMFIKDFGEHNRKGNYVAWDYAYNLLNSCEPHGILFTNGDNDTFPLWYLQEVENIRTDIRVVNLSLLNTPWYIDQLQNQEPKINLSIDDWVIDKNWILEPKYQLDEEAGCRDSDALNYQPEKLYDCDYGMDIPDSLKYDMGEDFDDPNKNGIWDEYEGYYDDNKNCEYDAKYEKIDHRYACCQYLDPVTGTAFALEEWSNANWKHIESQLSSIFKDHYKEFDLKQAQEYSPKEHGIPVQWSPAPINLNLYDEKVPLKLNPTISNYLKVQDIMILQILENIKKDRPIYFAVTVAPSNRLGLEEYLEMQGLVYQITNSIGPQINFDKMNFNITEADENIKIKTVDDYNKYIENEENKGMYRYTNLNNPNVYFPNHILRLVGNYRSGFLQLAIDKLQENGRLAENINRQNYSEIESKIKKNNEHVGTILDQMNSYFPEDIIDIDIPLNIQIASFYAMANHIEKSTVLLNGIRDNNILDIQNTNMLYQIYTDYLDDYSSGIELLIDFLEINPSIESESILREGLSKITILPNGIEILNTFKAKYPNIAEFRYNLAIAYAKRDNIDNAINELKTWLQHSPEDPVAKQFIEDLKNLQK